MSSSYEGVYELISKLPYYSELTSYIGQDFVRILFFTLGILIYGIVIWKFYTSLARRDLFAEKFQQYMSKWQKLGIMVSQIIKYTFAFPIYTFIWFLILTFFLITLSKSLSLGDIFFVSIIMISSTRAAAYYNEGLAVDIAKIIPLTFLGLFILDPTFFSLDVILQRLIQLIEFFPEILIFLVFTILLEWILRIAHVIKLKIFNKR